MPVIAIDFGTSYSSVAVPIGGQVEVLATANTPPSSPSTTSSPCLPTAIQFSTCERLIGADYARMGLDAKNRVFHIKRLLGRSTTTVSHLKQLSSWPFKIDHVDGQTEISVMYRHLERAYSPEQLAAMVMERLKQMAEERLDGQPVTEAVLSCPASFNSCQREALINAARIAGLRVIELVNETTAAAIAFRVEMNCEKPQNLLIFDMGGGSTNVSVIHVEDEQFNVIASTGNGALGGEDFTNQLIAHFVAEFREKHGKDLSKNETAMERLREACERAKCTLSVQPQAHISLPELQDGIHFTSRITRSTFESLCQSLFKRLRYLIEFILRESKVKMQEIDEVVILGGSSRIPQVQAIISEYCGGRALNRLLNPKEAVVLGTGVCARTASNRTSMTNGMGPQFSQCITEVIAHSLGVELNDDTFNPIVQRHKILPLTATKTYTTTFDDQTAVRFNLLAGDYLVAKHNEDIGSILISEIPSSPAGEVQISLTFRVDQNGLLSIQSTARKPGCRITKLKVDHKSVTLTEGDITEMIEEAKRLQSEDQENKNLALVKKALLDYVESKQKQLRNYFGSGRVSESDHDMMQQKYNSVKQWVTANPACSKYRYKQKQAELDVLWDDVTNGHSRNS